MLQTGKYLTEQPASWTEGDFDGNGRFNQFDIILIQSTEPNHYLQGPWSAAAATQSPVAGQSASTVDIVLAGGVAIDGGMAADTGVAVDTGIAVDTRMAVDTEVAVDAPMAEQPAVALAGVVAAHPAAGGEVDLAAEDAELEAYLVDLALADEDRE